MIEFQPLKKIFLLNPTFHDKTYQSILEEFENTCLTANDRELIVFLLAMTNHNVKVLKTCSNEKWPLMVGYPLETLISGQLIYLWKLHNCKWNKLITIGNFSQTEKEK